MNTPNARPVAIVRNPASIELHVSWGLHNRCNYECSYCPTFNRDGSESWLTIEKAQRFVDAIDAYYRGERGLQKVHISFTGGEPPLWNGFKALCQYITGKGMTMGMTSNGSLPVSYWREIFHLFEWLNFSYHPQFVNDDDLFSILRIMHDDPRTVVPAVRLMMHSDEQLWAKCCAFAQRVQQGLSNWGIEYVALQNDFGAGIEHIHYSVQQQEFLAAHGYAQHYGDQSLIRPAAHIWDIDVVYDNGIRQRLRTNELVNRGLASFTGWECDAGLEMLTVHYNGDITRGGCREGGVIGNIARDEMIAFPTKSVICSKQWCHCGTDMMVSKRKSDVA